LSLHILGLILLPLVVALSSPCSVPFFACMSRWIMSGRTMPLSSRVDMVLCTSDRKKFTTGLDMNLMFRICVHETKNKYCWWHNIMNTRSCLYVTYPSRLCKLTWPSVRKYSLVGNVSSFSSAVWEFDMSLFVHHGVPSDKTVLHHLFVLLFVFKATFVLWNLRLGTLWLEVVTPIRTKILTF
jgi:hypothetical protein